MALDLYADECVDARMVAGLRRRGVDVLTAFDERLIGTPDEMHLSRAAQLGRPIVTADHDFLRLVHARLDAEASFEFPGLIFILPDTSVGAAVRAIVTIATVLEPADITNRVEWVP